MKIKMMFNMEMQLKIKELLLVMKKAIKILVQLVVVNEILNRFNI